MIRRVTMIAAFLAVVLASTAWGQLPQQYTKNSQDGTAIPDVNKLPSTPSPDNSCWLASAANILAAAGYGGGGGGGMFPAQQRADMIYNQLLMAFGAASGGASDQAMSYWLAWYGKNPGSPDYRPGLTYTDVSAAYGTTLTQADYLFLKDELYRCQYVGVGFDNPPHAMTLIGWDDALGRSFWQDSDRNVGNAPGGGDSYINSFGATWDLVDPIFPNPTYLSRANGYWTLCPGLDKDPTLVANYDVAWAPGPQGVPMAREAGVKAPVFGSAPGWQPQWFDPENVPFEPFQLNNESLPNMRKIVELLVDFYGHDESYIDEDIRLRYFDPLQGGEVVVLPTSKVISADNGQVLFTWELDIQPQWEEILFPSALDYYLLEGEVASWNVATMCVPEPASVALLLLGLLGLLMLARRKGR